MKRMKRNIFVPNGITTVTTKKRTLKEALNELEFIKLHKNLKLQPLTPPAPSFQILYILYKNGLLKTTKRELNTYYFIETEFYPLIQKNKLVLRRDKLFNLMKVISESVSIPDFIDIVPGYGTIQKYNLSVKNFIESLDKALVLEINKYNDLGKIHDILLTTNLLSGKRFTKESIELTSDNGILIYTSPERWGMSKMRNLIKLSGESVKYRGMDYKQIYNLFLSNLYPYFIMIYKNNFDNSRDSFDPDNKLNISDEQLEKKLDKIYEKDSKKLTGKIIDIIYEIYDDIFNVGVTVERTEYTPSITTNLMFRLTKQKEIIFHRLGTVHDPTTVTFIYAFFDYDKNKLLFPMKMETGIRIHHVLHHL